MKQPRLSRAPLALLIGLISASAFVAQAEAPAKPAPAASKKAAPAKAATKPAETEAAVPAKEAAPAAAVPAKDAATETATPAVTKDAAAPAKEAAAPAKEAAAPAKDAAAPAKEAAAAETVPTTATPVPAAKPVAPAPPPPPPPAVVAYDEASTLFTKKKYDEAWKKLDLVQGLDGVTPELTNRVRVRRAEILMWRKKPDQEQARALILQVLHEDKEGKLFEGAIPLVQSMADDYRKTHAFIFHEPLPYSRPGRPLRLKAKVVEPEETIATVKLHFRGHDFTEYSVTTMNRNLTDFSFLLREPESLAAAGVTDDYLIDYYLTAEDSTGKVIDTDGTATEPITVTMSSAKVVTQEQAAGVDINAVTRAENAPPVVAPPPPAETPWYFQWYTLTAGGVIVAGTVTAIVLAATRPKAALPDGSLGTITFPVTQR